MTFLLSVILFYILYKRLSEVKMDLDKVKTELNTLKGGKTISVVEKINIPITTENGVETSQDSPKAPVNFSIKGVEKGMEESKKPGFEDEVFSWLKENTLSKIGVMFILLGFGWFVSYAFLHNWIGPVGRITLGFLSGTIITILGTYRLSKIELQGLILSIIGTAFIVLTALASYYYYNFFPPIAVLFIIFLTALYTSVTAVIKGSEKLSIYGVVLSLVAPYLSHTTNLDPVLLFAYLLIVTICSVWVVAVKKWQSSMNASLLGFLLYSLPYFFSSYNLESKYLVLSLIYLISIVYLITCIWKLLAYKGSFDTSDYFLNLINTVVIIGIVLSFIPPVYQSIHFASWMFIYAISGYLIFAKTKRPELLYTHALAAILFLGIATSIELSGQTLVIAFILETAIITLSSYILTQNVSLTGSVSMIVLVPTILSFSSFISNSWHRGILHSDFIVLFLMAVIYAGFGLFFKEKKQVETQEFTNGLSIVYLVISSIYLASIIWLSNHYLFNPDTAVFISLFIYTGLGLYTYLNGTFKTRNMLRIYGGGVLFLVVLRLILVDVWNMDLVLRVITFMVIGLMFVSTAFISKRQTLDFNLQK